MADIDRLPTEPTLKRADGEIAQPQVGETALLPYSEQRPVQREPDEVIAFLDGDPDAFAEITAVHERPAAERAAALGIGALDPEGERNRVAEQQVHIAGAQCKPSHIGAR